MNPEVLKHFFHCGDAFAFPLTRWAVIFVAALLAITPGIVAVLSASGKLSEATKRDIMTRWKSWIWLVLFLFTPILLGAGWVILGVMLLSLACYREFARATGVFHERWISIAVVFGILLVTFAIIDNYQRLFFAAAPLTIGLINVITIPLDRPSGYLQRVALGSLGFLLFGYSFGYLGLMTEDPKFREYLVLVLLGVELNDIFAYCSGRLFGKRKLLPQTSPGKTLGGAIGALVLTTSLVVLLGRFVVFTGTAMAGWGWLILLGCGMSVFGQLGDLLMSSIKRDLHVKDLGAAIPGHGGLLDRFDSLVLVPPAFYHLLSLVLGPLGANNGFERIFTGP